MFRSNVKKFKKLKFPHMAKILNLNHIVQEVRKKNNATGIIICIYEFIY